MHQILPMFFADVAEVCGHEKTFHANFCHQLLAQGLPPRGFAREFALNAHPVDVVLFAQRIGAGWAMHDTPHVAIEFKGGAYGTRNALRDEIDMDGHCEDLDKLLACRAQGIECWFICIDIAELGIALSPARRRRTAARCAALGIHFAYYAQTEDTCLIQHAGHTREVAVRRTVAGRGSNTARWMDCLEVLPHLVSRPEASEDSHVGMLYHALQQAGYDARQISLETYFSCAKGGGRMQLRPDICLFNAEVGGRFNLYRYGDTARSNDGIKIGNLQAVIEVKGSGATDRLSDIAFHRLVAADIDKLAGWRERVAATGYLRSGQSPHYVMLAIDNRRRPSAPAIVAQLHQRAQQQGIHFHYFGQSA